MMGQPGKDKGNNHGNKAKKPGETVRGLMSLLLLTPMVPSSTWSPEHTNVPHHIAKI